MMIDEALVLQPAHRFLNGQNGIPTWHPGSLWTNHFVQGREFQTNLMEPAELKVGRRGTQRRPHGVRAGASWRQLGGCRCAAQRRV
jgi:hypothetical protein